MYFSYRVKKFLIVSSLVLMIIASLVFVFVDFKTNPPAEAEAFTTTTSSIVTTTVPDEPNYQEFMIVNCQEIVIPFHKSTVNDFSLSHIHIQCFKWFAQQIANKQFTKIIVEGRSSCDDTPERGLEISKLRAHWGRDQLLKYGVPYENIEVHYLGYNQPLLDKGDCSYGAGADHNRSARMIGD